jgi:hypothetical protein
VTIFVVKNVRKAGKVRQKTLRNVAIVPVENIEGFYELTEHISARMKIAL